MRLSSAFCGSLAGRLHFDDVLVVGLVGELFEVARGGDGEAHAVADAHDVEAADRRGEIGGVVAAREVARNFGAGEVDDDLVAELAQAGRRARIGQAHDDAAGATGAAAEVDAADGARAGRRGGGGMRGGGEPAAPLRSGSGGGRRGRGAADQHDHVVARDARLVGQQAVEVQHQARAAGGFRGEDRVHAACAHVDAARRQRQRRCSRRSSEMRAGLSMVNASGSAGGAEWRSVSCSCWPGQVLHVDRFELVRRALCVRGRCAARPTTMQAASHNNVEAAN